MSLLIDDWNAALGEVLVGKVVVSLSVLFLLFFCRLLNFSAEPINDFSTFGQLCKQLVGPVTVFANAADAFFQLLQLLQVELLKTQLCRF